MTDDPTSAYPVRPTTPQPRGGPDRLAVAAVVIAAAVIVLIVAVLFARPDPDRGGTSATPSGSGEPTTEPSGSTSPSPSAPTTEPTIPPTTTPSASASSGAAPVLVGAGDIGDCTTPDDEGTAALLDEIDGTVFTAGDNAYESGTAKQFATCYDETWGRHKDRTRPAPGNHDWNTGDLDGYFGYFGAAAQGPDGESWYSYDLGAWHVIVLDSECGKVGGCRRNSAQGRWLAADLARSTATCTIAIWHKPRFSSGEHGNDEAVTPFWTALYAAGTDVVINGHDHDYERFAPQDPDAKKDPTRGIREFVVGTGGTPLREFGRTVANSELRVSVDHGVFKMTLREGSYDWEFIPTTSGISDRGTASCH